MLTSTESMLNRGVLTSDLGLALALALFWGSTYPIIRVAGNPVSILIGRYVLASIISIPMLIYIRSPLRGVGRKDLLLGSLAGVLNTGFVASMYYALLYIESGPVASIIYTYPLLILLISSIIGYSSPSLGILAGSALAFSGVVIIYTQANLEPLGVVLSMLASMLFALSSIISSRISIDPNALSALQNIAGLPIAVASYIAYTEYGDILRLDTISIIAIIHQGVGASFLAYLAWFALLRRSLEVASSVVYVVPASSYLIAIPVAREYPEVQQLAGLALIMLGIYIARRR